MASRGTLANVGIIITSNDDFIDRLHGQYALTVLMRRLGGRVANTLAGAFIVGHSAILGAVASQHH
jgi:hypothetical protein